MRKYFKNIALVASSTLTSRVLGLFRDILMFSVLGATGLSSAFLFAFTLPNLFRRLLGEGALSSAFIPIYSEVLETQGQKASFSFLNKVLSVLLFVLIGVVFCGVAVFFYIPLVDGLSQRWYMGSRMSVILFPYVALVCIAAILGAALNVLNSFVVPALSAVWLNLLMIIALGIGGVFYFQAPWRIVYGLIGGVLLGGGLQVIIPGIILFFKGWRPCWDSTITKSVKELFKLFLPAAIGASIFQINTAFSNFLAFSIEDSGVSLLYLANRLIEFPLGVFSVTINTVIFPDLAKMVAKKNEEGVQKSYIQGIKMILLITIPATFGLVILAEPVVALFFKWGRFTSQDVAKAVAVVHVFALGLPFYSLASFITRGFHSVKNTKMPVRIACIAFAINILLSLRLVSSYGIVGLAYSNLLFMIFQTVCLQMILGRQYSMFRIQNIGLVCLKIFLATGVMSYVAFSGSSFIKNAFLNEKVAQSVILSCLLPICVLVYFIILGIMGVFGAHPWKKYKSWFRRFFKKIQ